MIISTTQGGVSEGDKWGLNVSKRKPNLQQRYLAFEFCLGLKGCCYVVVQHVDCRLDSKTKS